VGKTLAATWLAQQLGKPLLILDLGTVMSRYLGATGANLKRAFGFALRKDGILLLDELDALAKRRDDSADVGELKRLVTVLLQELDDWPAGRLLIGATNHPQLLDNAVWRRFEARIDFPRPGATELRTLLATLTPPGAAVPEVWKAVLPAILSNTSQSEFVRTFYQLRKFAVLNPLVSPIDALTRVVRDRMKLIGRDDAKAIALWLAKEGTLSLRQISEFTHVSRDTMRRAGIKAR
jgi:SpoVK/Ycf46/Vps4 family AAA+-type ATPase